MDRSGLLPVDTCRGMPSRSRAGCGAFVSGSAPFGGNVGDHPVAGGVALGMLRSSIFRKRYKDMTNNGN
jgi:hypothetical protein